MQSLLENDSEFLSMLFLLSGVLTFHRMRQQTLVEREKEIFSSICVAVTCRVTWPELGVAGEKR